MMIMMMMITTGLLDREECSRWRKNLHIEFAVANTSLVSLYIDRRVARTSASLSASSTCLCDDDDVEPPTFPDANRKKQRARDIVEIPHVLSRDKLRASLTKILYNRKLNASSENWTFVLQTCFSIRVGEFSSEDLCVPYRLYCWKWCNYCRYFVYYIILMIYKLEIYLTHIHQAYKCTRFSFFIYSLIVKEFSFVF